MKRQREQERKREGEEDRVMHKSRQDTTQQSREVFITSHKKRYGHKTESDYRNTTHQGTIKRPTAGCLYTERQLSWAALCCP